MSAKVSKINDVFVFFNCDLIEHNSYQDGRCNQTVTNPVFNLITGSKDRLNVL